MPGNLFSRARTKLGWTPQDCARAAGYENADKGANRLIAIETGRDRFPDPRVWERFAEALGVPLEDARAAFDEESKKRAAIRCRPTVLGKPFAGFYFRVETPELLSEEELVDYAKELARTNGYPHCVVLSPVRCTYVRTDGTTFAGTQPPFMSLK